MSKDNTADVALERLRVRLQQLQGHHQVMLREIGSSQSLPPYAQLQSNWNAIQSTKMQIMEELKTFADVLSTIVVVPNAHFPKQSKNYLDTLLRTKYDPSTEDWMEQKQKDARAREDQQDREKRENNLQSLPDRELSAFWRAAAETANSHAVHHGSVILAQADYTWEEVADGIENVSHGLQRELREPVAGNDSEDDYEEEEIDEENDAQMPEDKMDLDEKKNEKTPATSGQPLTVNEIQQLMARGECQHKEKHPDERDAMDTTKFKMRTISI